MTNKKKVAMEWSKNLTDWITDNPNDIPLQVNVASEIKKAVKEISGKELNTLTIIDEMNDYTYTAEIDNFNADNRYTSGIRKSIYKTIIGLSK